MFYKHTVDHSLKASNTVFSVVNSFFFPRSRNRGHSGLHDIMEFKMNPHSIVIHLECHATTSDPSFVFSSFDSSSSFSRISKKPVDYILYIFLTNKSANLTVLLIP